MAQAKRASRTSHGGRQKANLAYEAKRQAKFAAKRANGTAYEYKPIAAEKGSSEWYAERAERARKNVNHRTDIAIFTSIMAKLKNRLKAEEQAAKKNKASKADRGQRDTDI